MTSITRPDPTEHLGLVHHVARKMGHGHNEDAISEGYLALLRAAERFDPARGTAFSSYAGEAISRAIMDYVAADRTIPVTSYEIRQERQRWTEAKYVWEDTVGQGASHDQRDRDRADNLYLSVRQHPEPVRLDAPLPCDEGAGMTLHEIVPADDDRPVYWKATNGKLYNQEEIMQLLDSPVEQPRWSTVARYEWDTILDGQPRRLSRGEDFDVTPLSFSKIARMAARRRQIRITVRVGAEHVDVQALGVAA